MPTTLTVTVEVAPGHYRCEESVRVSCVVSGATIEAFMPISPYLLSWPDRRPVSRDVAIKRATKSAISQIINDLPSFDGLEVIRKWA